MKSVSIHEHTLREAHLVLNPYGDIASILGNLLMVTVKSNAPYPSSDRHVLNQMDYEKATAKSEFSEDHLRVLQMFSIPQAELEKLAALLPKKGDNTP